MQIYNIESAMDRSVRASTALPVDQDFKENLMAGMAILSVIRLKVMAVDTDVTLAEVLREAGIS